ncbi:MAG TPA: tyrosine--tRNA ligase, partial [Acidimicrobiales bacterium]|nr:tyrosine--tRNA ligase [Acidimicrobiales bacterium]
YGMTSPLILKADGTKFGKSEQGTVWLDPARTSPYELFQFFLQTEDAVVGHYLRRLTFLDRATIEALDQATVEHPEERAAQRALARAVTTLVHGDAETDKAERAAGALFGGSLRGLDEPTLLGVFAEAPSTEVDLDALDGGLPIVDALVLSGLEKSKGAARRSAEQGGAYVNNERVDVGAFIGRDDLLHGHYVVLRRGKRDHSLLRFS